ncbi:hypothetical protein LX36DRAFT_734711 [Colletotrichum falcatum]|nr:hypothetical protein LX36DRAFT_734711 [Colletotrichum falcatum]
MKRLPRNLLSLTLSSRNVSFLTPGYALEFLAVVEKKKAFIKDGGDILFNAIAMPHVAQVVFSILTHLKGLQIVQSRLAVLNPGIMRFSASRRQYILRPNVISSTVEETI